MIGSVAEISDLLKGQDDVRTRVLPLKRGEVHLFYEANMSDADYISHYIVTPLLTESVSGRHELVHALPVAHVAQVSDAAEAARRVLSGDALLYLTFSKVALCCNARKIASRAVGRPDFDVSLKGPREGFNELLSDNLALIRKRVANPALKVTRFLLGEKAHVQAAMLYIEGRAPAELVDAVNRKLSDLKKDFPVNIHAVAEEHSERFTALDTSGYTELPDAVVSRLSEGRVAVLMNGSRFALTAPCFFLENLQAPDDYGNNRYRTALLRLLRLASFLLAIMLPGFYIAINAHHFTMIPTTFLFAMAVSRAGMPFPTIMELLLTQLLFEMAREAGKRLPGPASQPLALVTALILGQIAVLAGMVSEITVIVVGVFALATVVNPRLSGAATIWSLVATTGAFLFGLHGYYIALVVFVAHLASLRTWGYPFLFPLGTPSAFRKRGDAALSREPLHSVSGSIFGRREEP